jgi:hypothetical protein
LVVGFLYWGVLLLIRVGARLSFPEAVRNTDDFLLAFYLVQVTIAALMQAGLAAVVAGWVRRLGALHGLFSAFVAGCVMTVGLLTLNLVFGGTANPKFVWDTFSQIVNEGALLALPVAWVVSGLAELVRRMRERPRPVSQEQMA